MFYPIDNLIYDLPRFTDLDNTTITSEKSRTKK